MLGQHPPYGVFSASMQVHKQDRSGLSSAGMGKPLIRRVENRREVG